MGDVEKKDEQKKKEKGEGWKDECLRKIIKFNNLHLPLVLQELVTFVIFVSSESDQKHMPK